MKIFGEKEDEEQLTSVESLTKMVNKIEKTLEEKEPTIRNRDSRIEGYLVFQLVCSLNQGNSGVFHGRPEMAKRQLDELENLGYDLNQIYNSIYDTKR